MDTLSKLQQALRYMKEAEKLVSEVVSENETIQHYYGYSLEKLWQGLNKFSDNSKGYSMKYNTSLKEIIASEGIQWKNNNQPKELAEHASVIKEDGYFPQSIKDWVTSILRSDIHTTDEKIVKWFTEAGIHEDIAESIVQGERKNCAWQGEDYQIDFRLYEPDDDRLFTVSHMFDLAYETAQQAMSAAFIGSKSIEGLSIAEYINQQLDSHEGDGSYHRWIPRSEWPKPLDTQGIQRHRGTSPQQLKDDKNKGQSL